MGMPTSLLTPAQIRELFPEGITGFQPAPPHHLIHEHMAAGSITDDTQQTLLLARHLIEYGEVDATRMAWSLIRWAEEVNGFDSLYLGPSTRRALEQIRDGVPVEKAGWMGDTNGAAMRISPVGIFFPGEYEEAIKTAAEVCKPTHNTSAAISGAAAVACAVSAGMAGETLEGVVEAFLHGADRGLNYGNPWPAASIRRRTEWALELIRGDRSEREVLGDLYDLIGASVAMSETAPLALALVVYCEGDPMRVTLSAANLGGDADTIGAIAGSIAGAMSGVDAFPAGVLETIEEVNHLELARFAGELAAKVVARRGESVPEG